MRTLRMKIITTSTTVAFLFILIDDNNLHNFRHFTLQLMSNHDLILGKCYNEASFSLKIKFLSQNFTRKSRCTSRFD